MKHLMVAVCLVAVMGVSGCASQGENAWTPWSADRTAGTDSEGMADTTFNSSLRK